jgi:uncharacterized protein YqgC (DUF456 family)
LSTGLFFLGLALVLAGLVGTILPALPGTPLVFAGLLVTAWAEGFEKVGWVTLTVLGVLTLASFGIDLAAASLGAKRLGASWQATVGATVGTLVGLFLSLPGLILGPFVGAAAGEYLARRSLRQAGRIGLATWLGLVLGVAAKLALTFTMIGIFVLAYLI